MSFDSNRHADCEYIVVGSGAGGGTLAARLGEAGHSVLLLEAGGDPRELTGSDPNNPEKNCLPQDYDVPVFHGLSTENDAMSWEFFVRHYANNKRRQRDCKYREYHNDKRVDGVFYPRAGTLGGCTAHNALIMVYPHNEDWDEIAKLTADSSWSADNMRAIFQRMENCHHRPLDRWLAKLGINPSRHGWNGWLRTEKAIPAAALEDKELVKFILKSGHKAFDEVGDPVDRVRWLFESQADPNDWRLVKEKAVGIRYAPLTTHNHQRTSTRERVLDVARRYPDRLKIEMNALATQVLFGDGNRAIGIKYLKGERLYRAHKNSNRGPGDPQEAYASREVILAGGAFNTPQLLMLSGIGPRDVLQKFNIPQLVDLPGVGKNLQDRYEVGVVNRMHRDWEILEGAKFSKGDPHYEQWANKRKGVYTTNGAVLAIIKRSTTECPLPDLFCFALLGLFKGYFPGYSALLANHHNYLTWVILKARTKNRAGEVTLRSADARDPPEVNFHYFDEGSDKQREDLDSVVEGIKFVRSLTAELKTKKLITEEELPGNSMKSDDQLRDFVRDNAWGHHASCTCPIGPREQNGVLTSDFRVHDTSGLRVVDASVFPRIPGFFIVSAVYMVGEKAANVIIAGAKRTTI